MKYMTADLHFGHARICALANRPYNSVQEMNEAYVRAWNDTVLPENTIYVLGDYALGPIEDSLALTRRLMGHKILVSGNHDRTFPGYKQKEGRLDEWQQKYLDAGFEIVYPGDVPVPITLRNQAFIMSHFPPEGDHTEKERYLEYRPKDTGIPIAHGHTHSKSKFSLSRLGTPLVHVGIDAWGRPVSEAEILAELGDQLD